jgi:hypothetical protein
MTIPGRDRLEHRVSLVVSEDDRLAILEIDQQLALENQEELVSVIVLVPVELAGSRKRPNVPTPALLHSPRADSPDFLEH